MNDAVKRGPEFGDEEDDDIGDVDEVKDNEGGVNVGKRQMESTRTQQVPAQANQPGGQERGKQRPGSGKLMTYNMFSQEEAK